MSAQFQAPTAEAIERAAALLRAGELVAIPTETVYGLGADAWNETATTKIFAAKGRPADHPLIVHLANAQSMTAWARDIPKEAIALARAFWPGPLTLILNKEADVPDVVTGGQETVGLRVPNHAVALQLLKVFAGDGGGIAAPSANRFGRISPTNAQHVADEFGSEIAMILDGGPCQVGIESTILDLSRGEPVILRPGIIGPNAIAAVIGRSVRHRDDLAASGSPAPRVSGALAAHYAPRTPLRIVSAEELNRLPTQAAVLARRAQQCEARMWIAAPADAAEYAHDLYANLRALDAAQAAHILVEALPDTEDWEAVQDRLQRAAVGSGYG